MKHCVLDLNNRQGDHDLFIVALQKSVRILQTTMEPPFPQTDLMHSHVKRQRPEPEDDSLQHCNLRLSSSRRSDLTDDVIRAFKTPKIRF
jgi:hypothetical protein